MSQSLSMVYLHVVFSVKGRDPLLSDHWRDEVFRVIGGICKNIKCNPIIVGGMPDHIHALFLLDRNISTSDAVRIIKSNSSAWINETKEFNGAFRWQGGYSVFSVSHMNVDSVRGYIERQPERHAKQSFQDELRECMRENGTAWDERHIWD